MFINFKSASSALAAADNAAIKAMDRSIDGSSTFQHISYKLEIEQIYLNYFGGIEWLVRYLEQQVEVCSLATADKSQSIDPIIKKHMIQMRNAHRGMKSQFEKVRQNYLETHNKQDVRGAGSEQVAKENDSSAEMEEQTVTIEENKQSSAENHLEEAEEKNDDEPREPRTHISWRMRYYCPYLQK